MRVFRGVFFGAFLIVGGCGETSEQSTAEEMAEIDPAIGFDFDKADMFRDAPNDICRQKDPDFILKLVARIDEALPDDAKGSAQFERFFVQQGFSGKGQEAVVRFTARGNGGVTVPMFAIGPFDPESCKVGEMTGSVGKNLYTDADKGTFKIL